MISITDGVSTVYPTNVDGYNSERTSGTIAHEIPGSEWSDVTLRPAGPRSGTLTLGFAGPGCEVASAVAEGMHSSGDVMTLTATERASVEMSYVLAPNGRVRRELDDVTRDAWLVIIDYLEVQP